MAVLRARQVKYQNLFYLTSVSPTTDATKACICIIRKMSLFTPTHLLGYILFLLYTTSQIFRTMRHFPKADSFSATVAFLSRE